MGHVRVIAGTLTVRYGRFFPINFPKSTKTQCNKQIMRQRSAVFPHIFLRLHSKQPFRLSICIHISGLLFKTCSGGIVFGVLLSMPCSNERMWTEYMSVPTGSSIFRKLWCIACSMLLWKICMNYTVRKIKKTNVTTCNTKWQRPNLSLLRYNQLSAIQEERVHGGFVLTSD